MIKAFDKNKRRQRIRYRIRKKISGTASLPRLSIFRSNKEIYAQLVDDNAGHTLASASSREDACDSSQNKTEQAKAVGKLVAERASAAGLTKVVFDRSGYLYHGRVKALAEGAREGGLQF